jgi:glycerol uptake facilitator-like aquaporin
MNAGNGSRFPWRVFFSELVGTALLLLVGLSMVIVMFGTGSPMARLIPSEGLRRLIFWIGPMIGAFLASLACSFLAKRITVAKLYHFDSDRDGLFRRMSRSERTK